MPDKKRPIVPKEDVPELTPEEIADILSGKYREDDGIEPGNDR